MRLTSSKIKIYDVLELRNQLDSLYKKTSQKNIAKWSLKIAERTLEKYAPSYITNKTILEGFNINECWQRGDKIKIYNLRQIGFAIHRLAKE